MHAARAYGGDRRPGAVVVDVGSEVEIDGDDDVRVPEQDLLDRNVGKSAAGGARDVLSEEFDRLDVDRAAETGLEPAWSARIVDARPALARKRSDAAGDGLDRIFGIAREGFCRLGPADQRANRAIRRCGAVEAAIEQRIGT